MKSRKKKKDVRQYEAVAEVWDILHAQGLFICHSRHRVFRSGVLTGVVCASLLSFASASFAADAGSMGVTVLNGQNLTAPINQGGPAEWPLKGGISTQSAVPQQAAPSSPAAAAPTPMPSLPEPTPAPASPMPESAPASFAPPATPSLPAPVPASPMPPSAPEAPSMPVSAPAPAVSAPVLGQGNGAQAPIAPNSSSAPSHGGVQEPAPRPSASTTPPLPESVAAAEEGEQAGREVIYQDEQGNIIPKPLDPDKLMAEAQELIQSGRYDSAVDILQKIKGIDSISKQMRLETLYLISDCLWAIYKEKPLEGYEAIAAATTEALNADPRYELAPAALLRLGELNIAVKDVSGAEANIKALYRRYPKSPSVPDGLTKLGKAQLEAKRFDDAVFSFGTVLDKYPQSGELKEASMGLAKALYALRRHNDAKTIIDFINKRWPRCYLDDVTFLLTQADNAKALGNEDIARDYYWLYLNLEPTRTGNDVLLLDMADSYAQKKDWPAATVLYNQLKKHWPDGDSTITARMRLAERGIYDAPIHYDQMLPVFGLPNEPRIDQIYLNLADRSKTQPSAILSRLKRAMWLLWDKRYTEAMGTAADFIDAYPEHQNVPEARDIIWASFQKEYANALAEQNYGRILSLWNGFPLVRQRFGDMDSTMRFALAQGYRERGDDAKYLELLGEFLRSPKDPQYGEIALIEYFNRYSSAQAWDKILELARLVQGWDIQEPLRLVLDYSQALAAQNLGLDKAALIMWRQIAPKTEFPLYQRAYATYYLARDAAFNQQDMHAADRYYRDVLSMFTQLEAENSDKASPQIIKESIVALMDICEALNRLPEALSWLERYRVYVPDENSPEFPGLRYREARLYGKLGDRERSKVLLEDLIAKFPDSEFGKAAASELSTLNAARGLEDYIGTRGTGSPRPANNR